MISGMSIKPTTWFQSQRQQALLVMATITSVLIMSTVLGTIGLMSALVVVGALVTAYLGAALIISRQDALMAAICVGIGVLIDWYHLLLLPLPFIGPLVALAVISYRIITRSPEYPWVLPPYPWLWVLLPVLAAPAIPAGAPLLESLAYYTSIMVAPLVMYLLGMLVAQDLSQVRRLLSLLSGFGALIALHTIIEAQTGIFLLQTPTVYNYLDKYSNFMLGQSNIARAGSFLLNPDSNGTFLAVITFLPMGLFVESRSRLAKTIYGIELVLILVALLSTYSAGAIVAAGGGLVALILLAGNNRHRLSAAALLCTAAAVLYFAFPSQLGLLLQHGADPGELSLRTGIWETAIRMIRANPLTGIGLSQTTYTELADIYRVPLQFVAVPTPHNSYLELAAFAGLPVLAVFLAILGSTLWRALRNLQRADRRHRLLLSSAIAAAITLSINSLDDPGWTLRPVAWMVWILLGAASSPILAQALTSGSYVDRGYVPATHAETELPVLGIPGSSSSPRNTTRGIQGIYLTLIDKIPLSVLRAIAVQVIALSSARSQTGRLADAESYLALVLQLVKNSGVYVLASMASPLIYIVLAPFLTHHLSPTDYGILTILNTTINLVTIVTQLGLLSAFFRAYNQDYSSQPARRDVLATALTLLLLVSVPTVIGMVLMAPALANILLHRPSLGSLITLTAGVLLLLNLTVPGLLWLQAESRALFSSTLSIGSLVITLSGNLVLVGVLHLGVAGSLIAMGSGYACVVVCTVPVILLRAGIKVRRDVAINLLTFGVPQIPGFLAYWLLQLSDRYLLSLFSSLAQVASYSVSYMIGWALFTVLIAPFELAWSPTMYAIARRSDAANVFRLVFRWYSIALLFAAFGLSLAGPIVLGILFPAAYHTTALIIPVIAASSVAYGVYYIFMVGANVRRKTWFIGAFVATAAIINVALNLVLIPRFGAMGAAVSTLIAYAALALLAYAGNQRIYAIPFEIGRFLTAAAVGTALYLGTSALSHALGAGWSWPISILALVIYGVGLLGLGLKG